jgi:hypothetical protein
LESKGKKQRKMKLSLNKPDDLDELQITVNLDLGTQGPVIIMKGKRPGYRSDGKTFELVRISEQNRTFIVDAKAIDALGLKFEFGMSFK